MSQSEFVRHLQSLADLLLRVAEKLGEDVAYERRSVSASCKCLGCVGVTSLRKENHVSDISTLFHISCFTTRNAKPHSMQNVLQDLGRPVLPFAFCFVSRTIT